MGELFQCHGISFGADRILTYEATHGFGVKIDPFIDAYNFVRELLTRRKPRVIIAGHDFCAVGAIRAIQDAGLSVPDDIAVMSTSTALDLSAITAAPKITSVDTLFTYRIRLAAEILKSRLEGDTRPVIYRETHGRIRKGETA
jgi:DNA-binding LacI/PurR family transcriptional regulator